MPVWIAAEVIAGEHLRGKLRDNLQDAGFENDFLPFYAVSAIAGHGALWPTRGEGLPGFEGQCAIRALVVSMDRGFTRTPISSVRINRLYNERTHGDVD